MTEKFIDCVNTILEEKDITKSRLSIAINIDKNSLGKYLRKQRSMPLHVALSIADYLNIDISKTCGIKTNNLLTSIETELIQELRKVPEGLKVQTTISLINFAKVVSNIK